MTRRYIARLTFRRCRTPCTKPLFMADDRLRASPLSAQQRATWYVWPASPRPCCAAMQSQRQMNPASTRSLA